jgi:hypothetical protein
MCPKGLNFAMKLNFHKFFESNEIVENVKKNEIETWAMCTY